VRRKESPVTKPNEASKAAERPWGVWQSLLNDEYSISTSTHPPINTRTICKVERKEDAIDIVTAVNYHEKLKALAEIFLTVVSALHPDSHRATVSRGQSLLDEIAREEGGGDE